MTAPPDLRAEAHAQGIAPCFVDPMETKMKRRVLTMVASSLILGALGAASATALAEPGAHGGRFLGRGGTAPVTPAPNANGGVGALAAPVLTTTPGTLGGDPDELNYSCVDGAVKYAIEATAVYCIGDVDPVPTVVKFEFSSTSCGAVQPEFDFSVERDTYTVCTAVDPETCPPAPTIDPESVSYRVKGLAVPRGPKGRQNNPFSDWSPPLPDLTTICAAPPG